MNNIKIERGIYQVTRFCCRSAMCIDCKQRGNLYGDMKKRKRIVHIDKIDQRSAEMIAAAWREFGAEAGRMPGMGLRRKTAKELATL